MRYCVISYVLPVMAAIFDLNGKYFIKMFYSVVTFQLAFKLNTVYIILTV